MLPFAAARSTCLSVFALVLPARQCYLARQPARLSSLPYPSVETPTKPLVLRELPVDWSVV